jgi:hypothetical protein
MPAQSWYVLTQAATGLLLGVVAALAWVVRRRRLRSERIVQQRWCALEDAVRGLERRLAELESIDPAGARRQRRVKSGFPATAAAIRPDSSSEPKLIAVPNIEAAPTDREGNINGLKERHAAIWALADTGATPDVIARATGQPIGQIELVLGLRRQIDATRTTISHAPHT